MREELDPTGRHEAVSTGRTPPVSPERPGGFARAMAVIPPAGAETPPPPSTVNLEPNTPTRIKDGNRVVFKVPESASAVEEPPEISLTLGGGIDAKLKLMPASYLRRVTSEGSEDWAMAFQDQPSCLVLELLGRQIVIENFTPHSSDFQPIIQEADTAVLERIASELDPRDASTFSVLIGKIADRDQAQAARHQERLNTSDPVQVLQIGRGPWGINVILEKEREDAAIGYLSNHRRTEGRDVHADFTSLTTDHLFIPAPEGTKEGNELKYVSSQHLRIEIRPDQIIFADGDGKGSKSSNGTNLNFSPQQERSRQTPQGFLRGRMGRKA